MDGGEKKLWIIANWKANKTAEEAMAWVEAVGPNIPKNSNLVVVLAARFSLLAQLKWLIGNKDYPIVLSSQDVSRFEPGAYTGEEPAKLLQDLVSHSIIGHSERRTNFNEDDDQILSDKVGKCLDTSIRPILCVTDADSYDGEIFEEVRVVAYEPPNAIGEGGVADTPENAEEVAKKIKIKNDGVSVLYGGSVNSENAANFTKEENINGLLIGRASLDPEEFVKIIKSCVL